MGDEASGIEVLLPAAEIASRVAALAARLAPTLSADTVAIPLLVGGLWFAADLTRALSEAGCSTGFDALWLSSYRDAKVSTGICEVRSDLQRPIAGRHALIIDDVFDSGLSLSQAVTLIRGAGARQVTTAVFARKPWPTQRALEPDFVAWESPARFIVGYGMDMAGSLRGLPYIGTVD